MRADQGSIVRFARVSGIAVGIALIGYVGFLVASQHSSQVALREGR